MGLDPSTTLHDVRWGDDTMAVRVAVRDLGLRAASHFANGYADATSMRQSPVYFPLAGAPCAASPSGRDRVVALYVMDGALHYDIGRGRPSSCRSTRPSAVGGPPITSGPSCMRSWTV